jgi:putative acetyltransferase
MIRSAPDQWLIERVEASADELQSVRELLREYAQWLSVDLCFQSFEQELADLPGEYQAPWGALWIARQPGRMAQACVALRPQTEHTIAELKRLYVSPIARGYGLGKRLTECAQAFAKQAGYQALRLDTLPQMPQAQQLYESLGFVDIPPYYHNPIAGTRYMECKL